MKKITQLTIEQENCIPGWVRRYESICTNTERIDKTAANKYARDLMKFLGRDFIACVCTDGPKAAWEAVLVLAEAERLLDGENPTVSNNSEHSNDIGSQVELQVREKIELQIHLQSNSRVWAQVTQPLRSHLGFRLSSPVRRLLRSHVRWEVRKQNTKLIWPLLDGQFHSSFSSYFNFCRDVIGINIPVAAIVDDSLNFGNIYPLSRFVVISDRMSACHTNEHGLHKDLAPAVEYLDGTKIWCLNGVSVPSWLVETPRHKIDPSKFATIENAEVRREFVRKVGVEAICSGSKVLDRKGDYELLLVDLKGETGPWPYLKMLNPSIKVWHVEAVDKSCDTVEKALQWRNQSEKVPEIIT